MDNRDMRDVRLVLVPTDFSATATEAVEFAIATARKWNARIVCLAVVEPLSLEPSVLAAEREVVEKSLNALTEHIRTQGTWAEPRLRTGDAAREILHVAANEPIDLIVMGTHGRKGFARALLGSVAESVVREAPCPVLTVRPGTTRVGEPVMVAEG